jgi:membrane protease subunit (stomatin/prohibitin family)
MGSRIIQPLTDYFAECSYSYAEIDANREEISEGLVLKVNSIFEALGFEMTDFRIEGTSFDDDTMKRINRIADMTAEAQAAQAAGLNYAQMQQLEAMREAARNEGGAAGMGMGLGAGMGFGNMMAGAMGGQMMGQQQMSQAPQQQAAPAQDDPMAVLGKLKQLLDGGLITQEEYDTKKQEVLSRL